jgi:protoporphyrinogen oxidase
MPGGSRRSYVDNEFCFDGCANVLDGRDRFDALYRRVLGDNVEWRQRFVEPRVGVRPLPAPFVDAWRPAQESFGYPRRGGMQALIDGFLTLLDGELRTGVDVVRILPRERCVVLDDERRIRYRRLIVTLPLPTLLALCGDALPDGVVRAARRLRTLSLRSIDIACRGKPAADIDWRFETGRTIVDRIVMHGNIATSAVADEHCALVCEIVHSPGRPLALHGSALVRRVVDDCVNAGLLASPSDVILTHETDFPIACVIDDDPQAANVHTIERWLESNAIGFTGSRGEWEVGRCAALLASAGRAARAARRATETARVAS